MGSTKVSYGTDSTWGQLKSLMEEDGGVPLTDNTWGQLTYLMEEDEGVSFTDSTWGQLKSLMEEDEGVPFTDSTWGQLESLLWRIILWRRPGAVSYTHLGVYSLLTAHGVN
eukprot:TRINITY_DN22477_c0_g1_i13.p1 TRINITY_DN22477_c0_g1~~TRINITY_DN22477_c0_g1_i13.p1  ORF type:complete len:111 (+),score=16.27 TRINITY_DN22477_c0_g1_i13:18-350(+)